MIEADIQQVEMANSNELADGDLRQVRPMFNLTGKSYVITGGGRGIGYAATRAIAEMGGNVSVMDVLPKPVDDFENLSKEFGVKTLYVNTDVTNETSLMEAFEQTVEAFGSVDGCVTAAGVVVDKPFTEHTFDEVSRLLDINVKGTFFASQLATQQMIKQGTGGSIVTIASVCASVAVPGHRLSIYHATKGAVKTLSKTLSVELAPHGIRINSISPGYIESDMTKSLRAQRPQLVELMHNAPPMKRIGNRNDLTGAMVYLLSEASSYTTGTNIQVTGGLHAGRIEA